MMRKLLLFTLLSSFFSISLMAQNITKGEQIQSEVGISIFKFDMKKQSFFSLKLNLELSTTANDIIYPEASFLSLQLQNPKTLEFIEFARIYLQASLKENEEIIYNYDLQMWQHWFIKNPQIRVLSNTDINHLILSMELEAEEGQPNINVIDIIPLWQSDLKGFPYTETGVSVELLPAKEIQLPKGTKHAIASVLISGQAEDISETSSRFYFLEINDTDVSKRSIWRDDCSLNPLQPEQEGWYLSRPNWCPGLKVYPLLHFIEKKYIDQGNIKLELSFQEDKGKVSAIDSYVTSSVLFALGEAKEAINLSINEIYSPNNKIWHESYNPICGSPVILIQNTGSEKVESITFNYGYNYQTDNKFRWKGELGFLEEEIIYLPSLNWYFFENGDQPETFTVHISSVNGKEKALKLGKKTSEMTLAEVFPAQLIFELNTDHAADLNGLEIFNEAGEAYFSSGELKSDTTYSFSVDFAPGCYEMIYYDEAKDGCQSKKNKSGFLRIIDRQKDAELKSFDGNFGSEVREQFMIFR
ncbi:hypothetical protein HNS38_17910 [Lentimicrobium sp. L6]|uniref:peptide-N-glycosidase F-related protein n=1 Tax=Lentimicrobium sp. L6 TaxID=2735916 RepID=UPI001C12D117|nr:peptide-N-glycosidase F-related protein [Lentimicrobium sp. L6]NPD86648.1 hypothetical protein [Lentimicrobium sp. L6]